MHLTCRILPTFVLLEHIARVERPPELRHSTVRAVENRQDSPTVVVNRRSSSLSNSAAAAAADDGNRDS